MERGEHSKSDDTARELTRPLGPEYVSYRKAGGPTPAPYLEGHRAIQLANEVLGFDGWSSEIKERKTEYRDQKNGVQICCSVLMRVTLKNGTFREDVGYGTVMRGSNMVSDLEKAGKEATTDGLKRVLRQFGESLGNCLYDKSYMNQLKAVNSVSHDLDVDNLRRPKRVLDMLKAKEEASKQLKLENTPRVPAAQPVPTSTPKPVPVTASKPAAQPVAKPAAQPVSKPVAQPASKPATKPTVPMAEMNPPKPAAPPVKAPMPAPQPKAAPGPIPIHAPPILSSSPPDPPARPPVFTGFLSGAAVEKFDTSKEFAADMSFDTSVELPVNATLRQDRTEAAKR